MVLLGPVTEEADDYSESLIFHTINSTALPLQSEHALQLILGQAADFDMLPEHEIAYSPALHFTRLLRDGFMGLPEPAQARLGSRPLTSLRAAAQALLEIRPAVATDVATLTEYAGRLLAALSDIVTRLEPDHAALCQSEFFIELAARVWEAEADDADHNSRVNASVRQLEQLARWLGEDGLLGLQANQPLSKQILDIFAAVRTRIPRRIFLARWYPTAADGEEFERAGLRLAQIRRALSDIGEETGVALELIDMGTEVGGTFPIHQRMYEAVASSDIILVDLTGVRPNVCVEAGFALRNHEKGRLIFVFQPTDTHPAVPFDLNTFRYEPFVDTGELPGKLKPHIQAILEGAALGS